MTDAIRGERPVPISPNTKATGLTIDPTSGALTLDTASGEGSAVAAEVKATGTLLQVAASTTFHGALSILASFTASGTVTISDGSKTVHEVAGTGAETELVPLIVSADVVGSKTLTVAETGGGKVLSAVAAGYLVAS